MENRSVGFSLAGLAGVGAVIAALSASQSTRTAIVAPAANSSATRGEIVRMQLGSTDSIRATYRHGSVLIEDYLRRRVGCAPGGSAACGPRTLVRDSLQVIIASVPDPFDSHLDWAYDAYLEAFRRAMASAGYVPDRYWLPAANDSLQITIGAGANLDTQRLATHEFYPGVLLFRSADPAQHRLALLYVVNELPTTGEHKEAFLSAVRERRLLMHDDSAFVVPAHVRDTLLLAGPIFSGAAASLRLAIDDGIRFVDPTLRGVRVVTGSATSERNRSTLSGRTADVAVRFQATLNSDEAMSQVLDTTLTRLGLRRGQVAILGESSTQYGARDTTSQYLRITFPLNIASLRNEVGDAATDANATGAIPGLSQAARTRLELRDKSRPRESPEVISALTVPTLELMLDEIMEVIDEHEIRAVVIQATDIRDQLMLAREIRARNRDAQVILFQGHRLLLRSDYAAQLNGALVITTYPLFLENQYWLRAATVTQPDELLTLSNDAALGTYNSVLTLLDLPLHRMEFGSPVLERQEHPAPPPVWLTAVARGAFVPITVTAPGASFRDYFGPDSNETGASNRPLDRLGGEHMAPRLTILALGVLFLGCCAVVMLTRATIERAPGWRRTDARITYQQIETAALLIHERIYATMLVIAISGMFVPIGTTMMLTESGLLAQICVGVVIVVGLITVACGVTDVLRLLARNTQDGFHYAFFSPDWRAGEAEDLRSPKVIRAIFRRGRLAQLRWLGEISGRALIALVGLLHFALTLLYATQLWRLEQHDRPRFLLFSFRALHVSSGMSPLLPLMLCGAGFALWSAWQWRVTHRLYMATTAAEEMALEYARSETGGALTDPLSRAASCVAVARASLFLIHPTGFGFVLTTALLVFGWQVAEHQVGSVERLVLLPTSFGWSYDALFWVGTYAMLVTGAWALYRISATWSALQSALAVLGETPLFNAFSRLPRHVSKLMSLNLFAKNGSAATRHAISGRWWELHRQLTELHAELRRPGAATLDRTNRDAAAALLAILRGDRHSEGDFCSLGTPVRRRHLRRTAGALRSAWRATDAMPARENSAPLERRAPIRSIGAALRTAEEFLAIECVLYVESVLHDLRLLSSFLLVTLLLSVMLLSSYPFQPQAIVKLAFIALVLSTVVVLFLVMTQMSRDDVLSNITGTVAGKVSWDTTMVLNLALFGAIPLLALLSSEFPGVRSFLFSWAEPMVRSVVKG